jgi:circadian clock protein KaiC
LQNAIRLSTEKKDKICLIDNKVIVLATKEDPKGINAIIAKIKSNLPIHDSVYLTNVTQYIAVYSIKVDERIQNADSIMDRLLSENGSEKNKLGIY